MPSRTRLTSETARIIEEFLRLSRRRVRGSPYLSREEQDRWSGLRSRIEDAIGGSATRHGDRRKALRAPSSLKVECVPSASAELGSAREISEGGIFLATDRPLPVGTPLYL